MQALPFAGTEGALSFTALLPHRGEPRIQELTWRSILAWLFLNEERAPRASLTCR